MLYVPPSLGSNDWFSVENWKHKGKDVIKITINNNNNKCEIKRKKVTSWTSEPLTFPPGGGFPPSKCYSN